MSNNADYLGTLEAAILIQHHCRATHKETVFVQEKTVEGDIVWQGDVESFAFDLTGHEETRTCYAWQHVDASGHAKIFAVLGNKVVDSPKRAVEAAIFAGTQPVHGFLKERELLNQKVEESRELSQKMSLSAEDLAAEIHRGEGVHEAIKQRRNPA